MNQPEPHRTIVEDYYRAMGEGDFDHVVSLHDPDVVCWMSGQSLVSGRFEGRTELYAHMGEHVLGPLHFGAEPYVKGSRLAVLDGDIAVGLLHGGLPAKDGGRYDQYYLQLFRFENGLIREIVEMFDTVMVEEQLMKHRLTSPRECPARPFILADPGLASGLSREGVLALAEAFVAALASGDAARLGALMIAGAEVRVIGSTPLSGVSNGPESLAALFADGLADARIVAADANGAVILARSGTAGDPQQYGLLVEADGEAIGCISVFLDTAALEAHRFTNPLATGPSRSIMPAFDVRRAMAGR